MGDLRGGDPARDVKLLGAVALLAVLAGCGGKHVAPLPARCRLGVYFRPDATQAQVDAVRRRLERTSGVIRVVYVSKAEAFRIMKRRHPELMQAVKMNPFPDALLAHPRTRDDYAPIARSLLPRPPGVATVHYPRFGPCARA
jgi:cell division protein FtsX